MKYAATIFMILFSIPCLAMEPGPGYDPALPNVLIISDSIGIGYQRPASFMLRAQANLFVVSRNALNTGYGLENIERLLIYRMDDGQVITQWAAILFNWGMHDTRLDDGINPMMPRAQYSINLTMLMDRLKATGSRLVWVNTSTVQECTVDRRDADIRAYNKDAAAIMETAGIPIVDMHRPTTYFSPELYREECDVHFSPEGKGIQGCLIADWVRWALQ